MASEVVAESYVGGVVVVARISAFVIVAVSAFRVVLLVLDHRGKVLHVFERFGRGVHGAFEGGDRTEVVGFSRPS